MNAAMRDTTGLQALPPVAPHWSRRAVEMIVPKIENRMWFFDTELLILAHQAGLTIRELPVRWVEDRDTKVKILSTAMEDIRGLQRMRFRRGE